MVQAVKDHSGKDTILIKMPKSTINIQVIRYIEVAISYIVFCCTNFRKREGFMHKRTEQL